MGSESLYIKRGGQNIEFHYYDRPFFQNIESVFLVHHNIEIDKDQNIKSLTSTVIKVKNYLCHFPPMRLGWKNAIVIIF